MNENKLNTNKNMDVCLENIVSSADEKCHVSLYSACHTL